MSDNETEKAKGTAKEVAGKVTGSDELAQEGQAQQKEAEHEEKAEKAQEKKEQHQGT